MLACAGQMNRYLENMAISALCATAEGHTTGTAPRVSNAIRSVARPAGDEHSKAAAAELEERNRIQSDNVGHRLLSKMGWKEGEVLLLPRLPSLHSRDSRCREHIVCKGTALPMPILPCRDEIPMIRWRHMQMRMQRMCMQCILTFRRSAFLQGLGASGSGISAPVAAVGTASGAGNKGGLGKQVGGLVCAKLAVRTCVWQDCIDIELGNWRKDAD